MNGLRRLTIAFSTFALLLTACGGGGGGGDGGSGNPPPAPQPSSPSITGLFPNQVTAGGYDPRIYVDGTGFTSQSVVRANGSARPTEYISTTRLRVRLTTLDASVAGSVQLTVANGNTTSGQRGLTIAPTNYTVRELSIGAATDTTWDPVRNRLYVLSGLRELVVLEPVSGAMQTLAIPTPLTGASTFAVSDDFQYIYFNKGTITRCRLPDLTVDLQIPFGASEIAVAPGAPRTIALGGGRTISVADDAIMRPNSATLGNVNTQTQIAWGANPTALYARNVESTSNDFYKLAVDANGVQLVTEQRRFITYHNPSRGIFFDRSTNLLHVGNGTQPAQVLDPEAVQWAGNFTSPGLATVDPSTNKVFLLSYTAPDNATIFSYDLTTFALIDAISFPQTETGAEGRLVRWGTNGLAYDRPNAHRLTLISGDFVSGRPPVPTTPPPSRTTVNGNQVVAIPLSANDIAWSGATQRIYAAVMAEDFTHGNSIATINPATGTVASGTRIISDPRVLAVSDDGQYLYSGLFGAGSIQRFTLPNLTPDVRIPLGWASSLGHARIVLDLHVAPNASRTVAAATGTWDLTSPAGPNNGFIAVYDDGVPRAQKATTGTFNSLRWSSDGTKIFAADGQDNLATFFTLSVNAGGTSVERAVDGAFDALFARMHYNASAGRVYSDNGRAVDIASGARVGNFSPAPGLIAIDPALNKAWTVPQLPFSGSVELVIQSYNLTTFAPIATLTLPIGGRPIRLIRWGANGLAFNTETGQVYLVSGSFVN